MSTCFEDPGFGSILDRNVRTACKKIDLDQLITRLADLDQSAHFLLQQTRQFVELNHQQVEIGPHGLILHCFNSFIVDAALLQSYEQINPLEVMDLENFKRMIIDQCKVRSTLPGTIAVLALQHRPIEAPDNDHAQATDSIDRARRLADNMLEVLNLSFPECYRDILSKQIERSVIEKTA